MSVWYYADAGHARQGPVEPAELVRLRLQGALGWDSLVWRDGMADWRPMRDFAAELAQAEDRGPLLATGSGSVVAADDWAAAHPAPAADPASPYAPPVAPVSGDPEVVHGGEVVYAGFWKRFAALVIDSVLVLAISWAVQIPLMIAAGAAGAFGGDLVGGGTLAILVISYGVGLLVPLLYFSWMHSSGSQASLGKMAIGIKVTRGSGGRIGFWRAFARYVTYFLLSALSLGLGVLVSAFTAGLTARKQALHDMACDTLVVDKWAFTDRPDLQRRELGAVTWVVLVLGLALLGLALLAVLAALAIPGMAG